MSEIDQSLQECIQKFRDAKTGTQVKTFVSEFEELMFMKTTLLTKKIMDEQRMQEQEKRKEPTKIDDQSITADFIIGINTREKLEKTLLDFIESTTENARKRCAIPECIRVLPDIANLLFEISRHH